MKLSGCRNLHIFRSWLFYSHIKVDIPSQRLHHHKPLSSHANSSTLPSLFFHVADECSTRPLFGGRPIHLDPLPLIFPRAKADEVNDDFYAGALKDLSWRRLQGNGLVATFDIGCRFITICCIIGRQFWRALVNNYIYTTKHFKKFSFRIKNTSLMK